MKIQEFCREEDVDIDSVRERILYHIKSSPEGLSYDEVREALENEGLYIDGLCLRKIISDLLREGILKKSISDKRKNRLVYRITGETASGESL